MFGFTNLTREETRAKERNTENNEPCYGGLSNRLDYEFRKDRRNLRSSIMLYTALFLMLGVTAAAGIVVACDFVADNRSLYFPMSACEDIIVDKLNLSRSVPDDGVTLVAVSHDQSVRYRIPRGVMIKIINSSAKRYSGFVAGDIIVSIDGNEVLTVDDLYDHFDNAKDQVFRVFRQNRYIDVDVRAGE